MFIDGFSVGAAPFYSPLEDSFVFIEAIENRVNWEFEAYSFKEFSNLILWGDLSDIRIDQNPAPIVGELFVYRNNVSEELLDLAHPNISGGLRSFNVGIDLLSNGAKGQLRILGRNGTWSDSSRAWTLEELSGEHTYHYYELD